LVPVLTPDQSPCFSSPVVAALQPASEHLLITEIVDQPDLIVFLFHESATLQNSFFLTVFQYLTAKNRIMPIEPNNSSSNGSISGLNLEAQGRW
jgi:hypothetical protein